MQTQRPRTRETKPRIQDPGDHKGRPQRETTIRETTGDHGRPSHGFRTRETTRGDHDTGDHGRPSHGFRARETTRGDHKGRPRGATHNGFRISRRAHRPQKSYIEPLQHNLFREYINILIVKNIYINYTTLYILFYTNILKIFIIQNIILIKL